MKNNRQIDTQAYIEMQRHLSWPMRILLGLGALPSLLLGSMLISELINQSSPSISFFEVIYALVGVFALYLALTGKKPF